MNLTPNGASSNLHNQIFLVGTQFFFQLKEEEDYKTIIIYLISNGILATWKFPMAFPIATTQIPQNLKLN